MAAAWPAQVLPLPLVQFQFFSFGFFLSCASLFDNDGSNSNTTTNNGNVILFRSYVDPAAARPPARGNNTSPATPLLLLRLAFR